MARHTPRRAVAFAAALLGVWSTWAAAATAGDATGTAAVGSGTFGVIPAVAGGSTLSGPLTFAVVPLPAYLDALNTGTLALTGTSYSVSFVYTGIGTPTVTLSACPSGTWSAGICSTSAVTIGSWTPGSTTIVSATATGAFPAAAGSRLPLKAVVSGSLTIAATVTVTTQVSSGPTRQVRTATATDR